ncbi:MAG: carbohydrate kinase [Pedosphaera sp.]|nr:carbohydrate kinase [Pedosphaera sp.]
MKHLAQDRVRQILAAAAKARVLVVGDVMLDHFIWGRVHRISPEAPVPVVEFERESFMAGGAANVARNLAAFGAATELLGVVGRDAAAGQLKRLLATDHVNCAGLLPLSGRPTTKKMRLIAHRQQVARLDHESAADLNAKATGQLLKRVELALPSVDAVILGDYGKGTVTTALLDGVKSLCRARSVWLSVDPKPLHQLDLTHLSLITPNRKEAFELAGIADTSRAADPLSDVPLQCVVEKLLHELSPALLLITLGDLGMLLCRRGERPFHIPTIAREVFDVSGAGDTVVATFTLAVAAGASPIEAAILSNHAGGVVVGKLGTATVTPEELLASFTTDPK